MSRTPRLAAVVPVFLAAVSLEASQNKLVNGAFGTDLSFWTQNTYPDHVMTQTGAIGHAALGAFQIVEDGTVQMNHLVMYQCVAVKEGASYNVGAYFRFPSSLNTLPSGYIAVQWSPAANCPQGNLIPPYVTTPETVNLPDTWQHTTTPLVAPATAKGALVEVVVKSSSQMPFQAWYDDISFTGGVKGDADGDGSLAIADVFYLINNLFAGGPLPIGPCDVDNTDLVNVSDVFYLINYLFAKGPAPL